MISKSKSLDIIGKIISHKRLYEKLILTLKMGIDIFPFKYSVRTCIK